MAQTDLLELKQRIAKLKEKKDKAEGAVEQLMSQLEKQHQCSFVTDAEELLAEYKKEEAAAKVKFDKALAEFEEKWNDKLGME